jgi:hypothetical protein
MGRDKAFSIPALHARRQLVLPYRHGFQDVQQFACDLDVPLVACMVEGDQDRIREPPFAVMAPTIGGILLYHRAVSAIYPARSPWPYHSDQAL